MKSRACVNRNLRNVSRASRCFYRFELTIFILISLFILISSSFADEINYFCDETHRLANVAGDSRRAHYQYDEAGNLFSIITENSTAQTVPPVLQSIAPDIFSIGNSYRVVVTRQSLLSTTSITSSDPNVTITNVAAIDSTITATLSVAGSASPSQVTLTVSTSSSVMNKNNPGILDTLFPIVIPAGGISQFTETDFREGLSPYSAFKLFATTFDKSLGRRNPL